MELTLCPQGLTCGLHEGDPSEEAGLNFVHAAQVRHRVFSDQVYDHFLIRWGRPGPNEFSFFINGEYKKGRIVNRNPEETDFYPQIEEDEDDRPLRLFEACYGFIRLEIECRYWNGSDYDKVYLYSDYLEVMIRPGEASDALDRMFGFIGRMHQRYILAETLEPIISLGEMENRDKTLVRQISLIQQIRETFEDNLPYFKTNPHTVLDSNYRVREFEKLRQVTPATVAYIVQHPDLLIPSQWDSAVRYQGQSYMPVKTLILEAAQSRDCYENGVVIGFFLTVMEGITALLKKTEEYMAVFDMISPAQDGYESSARVIMHILRDQLYSSHEQLLRLQTSIGNLYWTYRNFLPVTPVRIDRLPKLTSVFLSVAPYRQIYEEIVQWFDFGSASFRSEDFMLPFMVNSSIYEYYLLFKFADSLEKQGFVFYPEESSRFLYAVPGKFYKQVPHTNTFVFRDQNERTAVLYFQPVIFGNDYSPAENNGIALRRTTTLNFGGKFPGSREGYFTPDYVLKIRAGGREKYLIADAKHRSFRGDQIPELAYKYSFAIQPASPAADLAGTLILYGKDYDRKARLRPIFDIWSDPRFPKFWITSLTESPACPSESHTDMFEDLIRKLLNGIN